jgi:hypothetical protein
MNKIRREMQAQSLEHSDYKFSVIFCDAPHYSTPDALRIISRAAFDSQSANMLDLKELPAFLAPLAKPSTECKSTDDVATKNSSEKFWPEYLSLIKEIYIDEELRDLQIYYTDRLLKLISSGEIELWNSKVTKIVNLTIAQNNSETTNPIPKKSIPLNLIIKKLNEHKEPILDGSFVSDYRKNRGNSRIYSPLHKDERQHCDYHVDLHLFNSSIIHRSDLLEFCEKQKIEVTFPKTKITTEAEIQQQPIETPSIPTNIIKVGRPGKKPNIAIAELVIEIAWDIERAAGVPATANEVMTIMRNFVTNKLHRDVLFQQNENGIEWRTVKGKINGKGKGNEKDTTYTKTRCKRTLDTWNKSRN